MRPKKPKPLDAYADKVCTAAVAVSQVRNGDHVFAGPGGLARGADRLGVAAFFNPTRCCFASGLEIPAAGMVMRDCRYASKNFSVMVKTSQYSNPAAAKDASKLLAGKLRAIPNDPDGVLIQEGQGDATTPAVFYVRNGVAVELRVLGVYYKDLKTKDADLRDMQTKLAAIKRLP